MQRRQVEVGKTRTRVLAAARGLLLVKDFSGFSMEAVARKADVSRLTVYYQFKSKAGLLEALYDYIAKRGHMEELRSVFGHNHDPLVTLHDFILVFMRFWASDRDVIRRLHALGTIDPDIGKGLQARNERRRQGVRTIVERYSNVYRTLTSIQKPIAVDAIHMLTSFETFDALSGNARSMDEVTAIVREHVNHAIGIVEQMPPARKAGFSPPMPKEP
jgi:AcrR family transcriptional regulator